MSTKIYQAVRAPADRVVDLIDWAHDSLMAATKAFVEEMMAAVTPEAIGKPPEHVAGNPEGERRWERYKRFKVVEDIVKESGASPYKQPFDIDCGFNLWFLDGHVYMMPIGPNRLTAALETLPEWCEDFGYWDNADEPYGVSIKEWKKRGKTWERICTGKDKAAHNARRLFHEVVDTKSSMGMFELKWDMVEREMWEWSDKLRAGTLLENGP